MLALGEAMVNHAALMRRPGLCSKALIAALVAGLSSAPVTARPLVLPDQLVMASSGPRLVLVVVPLDAPSKATQGVLELVGEGAARGTGKFEVVAAVDAFDPKLAAERLGKAETARTKMVDGQKALDDLDTAKGVTEFGEAVRLLKETDTSRSFDELMKAWVMKAASHAMGGEVPPAKQEIERIVAVQPKAEFNSQFFPPDLLKFVEQQRKLASAAKGELTLRTEPAGANVWINGKHVGRSPLSVKGLLGSRHQVVAALGGSTLTLAELPPGDAMLELKPAELAPALSKTIDTVTKSPKTAARDQALVALGKKLQVDQVLALLVKKSTAGEQFELTALRIEVRDGHNAAYATATQPLAEPTDALKTFFDSLLTNDTPRQGKTPVTHFDGDAGGGGGGSGKKIVGIALLGVAAGLVAAGIGTGVVGQQRYEQFRATPQVQSGISQGYANEARALGGVSLGSFIGAGVAAGVGTFLLVSSGKSSGEESEAEPEPKKPAKKKNESKKPDPKKEEPKKEEPKKEEPKKEDPKKTEPVKEEPKKEEPPPAKVDPKEEKRRKDEEAKKAKEEEARLKKEEEQRAKDEAEAKKKADADAKKAKEEEARRAEEEKKQAEADAKKAKEEEARRAQEEKKGKKVDPKKKAEEEAAAAKAAEEEKKKKEDEERKKKEDEEKKRREEEEKKKAEQKKKEEDHDDLRNY